GTGLRPRRGGTVKAVEHMRKVALVDSGSMIAHGKSTAREVDVDGSAGRAPLRRIVEEVADRTGEAAGDAAYEWRLHGGVEGDARCRRPGTLDGILDQLVQLNRLRFELLAVPAGELEDLGDQGGHLVELTDSGGRQPLALGVGQGRGARKQF